MFVLKGRRDGGSLIAFSPDGRALAARSEGGLQVWPDFASGVKPVLVRQVTTVGWLAFAPDGSRLFIDSYTSGVYDLRTHTFTPHPPKVDYRFLSLSSDGKSFIVSYSQVVGNRVVCWPVDRFESGKPRWSVPVKRVAAIFRPFPLLKGRFLLPEYLVPDRSTRLYRFTVRSGRTGEVLATVPEEPWGSDWDAVSPDGRWLARARGNRLAVWSLTSPARPPVERFNDSAKSFTGVAFHPSGRYLAASASDGTVKLYDVGTWALARTYAWGIGKLTTVAFSPDGLLAAAGTDSGRIVVWDVDV
jgi:WD40 repeat protein